MGGGSINSSTISYPPVAGSPTAHTAMSTPVNLVMTTFGFLVSAIFIIFVLVRLICARFQGRRPTAGRAFRDQGGERSASGMDPLLITLFPTIKFSEEVFASQEDATCAVCLGEYEHREFLRILPQCGHTFHVNCIDSWLRQHATCPVCRVRLQSSPIRRNIPSPLLSAAARSRFSPGVIPENLFQQPLFGLSSRVSDSRSFSQLGPHAYQERGVREHGAQAHIIQIDSKEDSEVSTQNTISSSQPQAPLEVSEGLSSAERLTFDGGSQDITRSSPSMVQVQVQARDPYCKLSDESSHVCKSRLSTGFSSSMCSVDENLAGRSSFSEWVSRS